MRYKNLHELIYHSSSTRRYLLSLPVSMQLALHEYSNFIHTTHEIRIHADAIKQREPIETCFDG